MRNAILDDTQSAYRSLTEIFDIMKYEGSKNTFDSVKEMIELFFAHKKI
jgi:hypothetical protein